MHFDFALQLELGDAPQVLAQDFFLDLELVLVGGVLVLASAAMAEVRTRRLDAVRRGLYYFAGLGSGKARLLFGERGFDLFCGEGEGNEHGFAASAVFTSWRSGRKASEAVAAVDQLFYGQEQVLILRHVRRRRGVCDLVQESDISCEKAVGFVIIVEPHGRNLVLRRVQDVRIPSLLSQ